MIFKVLMIVIDQLKHAFFIRLKNEAAFLDSLLVHFK